MQAIGNPLRTIGTAELLLLVPGTGIAVSNFVQHAAASGFGSSAHAIAGFLSFVAAFNLIAVGPLLARKLPAQAPSRLFWLGGHCLIVAVGAPLQFALIAAAIVFFRDHTIAIGNIGAVQAQSLSECGGSWIAVYAFLVALDSVAARPAIRASTQPIEVPRRLASHRLRLQTGGTEHLLETTDIGHIRSLGDYVQIHAAGRRLVVHKTMNEVEELLTGQGFIRVHRSALVRASDITAIKRGKTGTYDILLQDGTRLPLSRRRLRDVHSSIEATAAGHSTTIVDHPSKSL